MVKILFIEAGGHGEVLAELVLAVALQRRGHHVSFVTASSHESMVTRHGLEFIEYGRHPGNDAKAVIRQTSKSGLWALQGIQRSSVKGHRMLRSIGWPYEFIARQIESSELLVIGRFNEIGTRLANERLGVPMVSLHLQPAVLRSRYHEPGLPIPRGNAFPLRWMRSMCWRGIDVFCDRRILRELNCVRSELGLQPVRRPLDHWVYSPGLNLGLFPDWYGPPQPDWPENTALTGFPVFEDQDAGPLAPEVQGFLESGEPPVVFTRGSHGRTESPFFAAAIRASKQLGVRSILAGMPRDAAPADLPSNVLPCKFAPFSKLLPRAAAIVHHGGIGTTALSLAAGIPQVVAPTMDDQFYNARRVEQLQLGVRVRRWQLTPEAMVRNLQRLLASEDIVQKCRATAAVMRADQPMEEACRQIEQYWQRTLSTKRN